MKRAALLCWLAAALLLSLRATRKREGALARNRAFAALVVAGRFPYERNYRGGRPIHAPYPPSYGLVMAPLLLVPEPAARVLWVWLQLAVLALVLARLARWHAAAYGRPPPLLVPLLALLLASRYLLRDTAGGGNNLLFGGLVLFACCRPDEARGEDRRPALGLLLGLVLAAKPTPILFVPWLFWRGRVRSALWALATAASLHLAPLTVLGPGGWARAYGHWLAGSLAYATEADVFAEPALAFPRFTWMNQSLHCLVARYFGRVPPAQAGPLLFPGLGLGTPALRALNLVLALALLALTAARLRAAARGPRAGARLELFGPALLFALTLLLSPISWKAHHVRLLPAFYLLAADLCAAPRGRRGFYALFAALYFAACVLPSEEVLKLAAGSAAAGKAWKNVFQAQFVTALGCLALLVFLPGRAPDEPKQALRTRTEPDGRRQRPPDEAGRR